MFEFLTKFFFLWKKTPIVIVTGQGSKTAASAILGVLKPKIKDVVVKQAEPEKAAKFFLFKNPKSQS